MNWLFRLIDKKYKVALEDAENLRRENDDLKDLITFSKNVSNKVIVAKEALSRDGRNSSSRRNRRRAEYENDYRINTIL